MKVGGLIRNQVRLPEIEIDIYPFLENKYISVLPIPSK